MCGQVAHPRPTHVRWRASDRTVYFLRTGELDATNAIVCGMVMVDDLAQLMAFKMAFKLERAVFNAYLASGRG